jgi:hypothetical protein
MREIDLLCDEAESIVHRLENYVLSELIAEITLSPPPEMAETRPEAVKSIEFCGDSDQTICSICLNEFENPSTLSALPCGHYFHPDCVACWVCEHPSCPVCRHSLA